LLHGLEVAAENVGVDKGKVGFTLLELACMNCEEVGGGKFSEDVRHKKGGKSDIEGKDRLNTMGHEKGGVSGQLVGCHTVCPKCVRDDNRPL
jgi:hypothetical protein